MANLQDIRKRIDSVQNTRKITNAMKMVATAKLRKAEEAVKAARPYARQMRSVIANIYRRIDPSDHPLLSSREKNERSLIYVISTNRGLCGSFNLKLFRLIKNFIKRGDHGGDEVELVLIGRKSKEHFAHETDLPINKEFHDIIGNVDYEQAERLGAHARDAFLSGRFDSLYLAHNSFVTALEFNTHIKSLLPISIEQLKSDLEEAGFEPADEDEQGSDYLYEPSQDELLKHILPTSINVQFLEGLLESNAAEQGTRMTAMDNATENADDLIDELTLTFNRARQAQITRELCDIVTGAEALED